jgi:tyramine---L-glutamate ligase
VKIALLEFLCSSGAFCAAPSVTSDPESPSLLLEGYAMLASLGNDLTASGHEVHGLMVPSIADWARAQGFGACAFELGPIAFDRERSVEQIAQEWVRFAKPFDATMVIAPELDGLLRTVVRSLRDGGVKVMGPNDAFLNVATDKKKTSDVFMASDVRHPRTWLLQDWLLESSLPEVGNGWVVKRRWGAGGVGMRRFPDANSLRHQATVVEGPWRDPSEWIVQPWVEGRPASIGVVTRSVGPTHLQASERQALGAMEQIFSETADAAGSQRSYVGGRGPLEEAPMDRVTRFAEQVLQAVPGHAAGWIGIDFLIEPDGHWTAIEINARLTSSYLGYRMLYGSGLAGSLVDEPLPPLKLGDGGKCCFSVKDFRG